MENEVNRLKEVMHEGMMEAFKQDGSLAPVLFYYQNGEPFIIEIPSFFLEDSIGKSILAKNIKNICSEPTTLCAGIVVEAYGIKLDVDKDKEDAEKLQKGELDLTKHPKAVDIILLIFSTPEKSDMIAYEVDCDNKTIGEKFSGDEAGAIAGRFADFFSWIKN
ncbi:MAG: hypothetical protein ACOC22_01115 [bacterium]